MLAVCLIPLVFYYSAWSKSKSKILVWTKANTKLALHTTNTALQKYRKGQNIFVYMFPKSQKFQYLFLFLFSMSFNSLYFRFQIFFMSHITAKRMWRIISYSFTLPWKIDAEILEREKMEQTSYKFSAIPQNYNKSVYLSLPLT